MELAIITTNSCYLHLMCIYKL